MAQTEFYLAPIQGITDNTFRNLFCTHFLGVDKVFAPFVRLQNGLEIKKSQMNDLLPKNNRCKAFVPQILSNNANEILYFAEYIQSLGYSELNWNLGCPFPMVTKRQMGSGLLPFTEKVDNILELVFRKIAIRLSIKMRLGYSTNEEAMPLLKIMNKFPISEIIIHPRLGKQMYKGSVDLDSFSECLKVSNHSIGYNGDINYLKDYKILEERFGNIHIWMLGRGLLSNPFLLEEILEPNELGAEDKLERFSLFHHDLQEAYSKLLSGPGHLLSKMHQLWEYFSCFFEDQHKVFKAIKKTNSIEKYQMAVYHILNSGKIIL
jgi:tRNA-dihydrouridine synthase B